MSKMFYNYNGCSVNIYSIDVDVKRLIMIRETIIKRCSQYNHTVYEVKGYPNMMDKSKKYLSVTDTGKKEKVKINSNDENLNKNMNLDINDERNDENIQMLRAIRTIVNGERGKFIDKIITMYNDGIFDD